MARICVLADDDHAAAAASLRAAGFEVLIDESYIERENAVFFEANKTVADDADTSKAVDEMLEDVAKIVDPYRSNVADCGVIGAGHVPFDYKNGPTWATVQ
jgi:hypothetical protein